MKRTFAMTLFLCLTLPSQAFAYLDGGTISMALQLIAGGIGIGFLFLRRWLDVIRGYFNSKRHSKNTDKGHENSSD